MMKRLQYLFANLGGLFAIILLSAAYVDANAQTWRENGSRVEDYDIGGNPNAEHGSDDGAYVVSTAPSINGFGGMLNRFAADSYFGKRIRLSAYIRTFDVDDWCGLWMRVDAGDHWVRFDNMARSGRAIEGDTEWQEYEIILHVPENSTYIYYGFLLSGTGEMYVDGLRVTELSPIWQNQNSGTTEHIYSMKAVDENTIWAGAGSGVYLRSTDGGQTWMSRMVENGSNIDFLSIAAIDANTAYFLAQRHNGSGDSRIYKTTDGGETMTLQYQNKHHAIFFNSIAFFDENNGIAIADPINGSFVIETTSNGGEQWTRVPPENIPPPLSNEFAGFGDAGGTVLTVQGSSHAWFGTAYNTENGLPHRILRSTDKGENWTAVETPLSTGGLSHGIGTIAFIDSLTGFAGSSNYPVLEIKHSLAKTTDGGKTWNVVSSFLPITISTLNIVPQTNGKVLFVTSPLGIAYSQDSGETWEHPSSTSQLSALSFAGPNAGWAGGAYGEIVKSVINLEPTETKVAELNQEFAPTEYALSQNYPNPFNPITTISFSLPEAQFVTLAIYDMNGRLVKKLMDNAMPAGHHSFVFDGNELPSGVYLYRLVAGAFAESRKMMLVK